MYFYLTSNQKCTGQFFLSSTQGKMNSMLLLLLLPELNIASAKSATAGYSTSPLLLYCPRLVIRRSIGNIGMDDCATSIDCVDGGGLFDGAVADM